MNVTGSMLLLCGHVIFDLILRDLDTDLMLKKIGIQTGMKTQAGSKKNVIDLQSKAREKRC